MAEKLSVHLINLCSWKVLPSFLSAEEMSKKCGMSTERLIELANAEIIPHVRIDNGPPLFLVRPMLDWVKENALYVQDGQKLPINLVAMINRKPDFSEIPEELQGIAGKLKKYENQAFPPCVYFLIREGRVVYVGQTTTLPARIQTHMVDKLFDEVLYMVVPPENLLEVERSFISLLTPEYNKEVLAKKTISEKEK
jgi:hypothetical protein